MSRKWYFVSTVILGIIIMIFINTTPKMNSKPIPKTSSISTNRVFNKNVSPKVIPIGRLIIEKIKLDQALYDINSPNNNVEENVTILKGSSLPTDNKGTIFLAAHSGTGDIAYFNDLDKLKVNDEIIFKYNNINYHYLVDKIFEEEKDGDIEITKSSDNQLVLTTCSKKDSKKQLIVNSNLIQKEEIT